MPADDDLFLPMRHPTDETASQADDTEEGEDVAANADADAMIEDGSDASEESDEVSSFFPGIKLSFEDEAQDIEFIMEPANRSLDLRCVALSLFLTRAPSLSRPSRPAPRNANSTPQKGLVVSF